MHRCRTTDGLPVVMERSVSSYEARCSGRAWPHERLPTYEVSALDALVTLLGEAQ